VRPAFCIRRFRADEWPAYRELRLRALADAPDAFARTHAEESARPAAEWASRLAASAASPTELAACAERDGRAVGLVYTRLDPAATDTAHLYSMWVDPAARGAGVGAQLVGAVVDFARGHGARTLLLQVTEGNAAARRLYERAGFAATDELSPLREGSPLRVRTFRLAL
jgi:ribosomal protein S18 acetylase RimI-like enzyme